MKRRVLGALAFDELRGRLPERSDESMVHCPWPQPVFEVLRRPVHIVAYSRGSVGGMGMLRAGARIDSDFRYAGSRV